MITFDCLTNGRIVSANFLPPGVSYVRDRHFAEEDFDLGENGLRDRFAGDGEGGGVGRMAMDDALHVWPGLHDFEVEQHFAGALLAAGELVALHVDEADVVGLQEAFAVHRGRAEDFVLVEADA